MEKKTDKPILQPGEVRKWAGSIVLAAKDTINEVVDNIKESSDEFEKKKLAAKRKKDLLLLRPVFKEMLPQSDKALAGATSVSTFTMPEIIHVVEKDKKHAESDVCNHSLGHLSKENGVQVLNVYPHHLKDLNLEFYPNNERDIYYVDPCQKNHYIDIQEYFQQLKVARVSELERLAYSLGAKHVEIVFKTNNVELEKAKKNAELGAKKGKKKILDVKAEHSDEEMKKESIEVEKILDLSGHDDPQIPELIYFKDNPDIQNLIHMRIDKKSYLKSKECSIKYSNSSGIKQSDAVKIQGALDKIGNGNAGVSIMNDTLTESCTTLIYKIEF